MKILVTGSGGKLGRWVVDDLIAHDHEVVAIDRMRGDFVPSQLRSVIVDLLDLGQVTGAMEGCEAVIHLGAIPNPYWLPDEVVFTNNTQATFNVLQAARLLGLKRAAIASSCSAYGAAWCPWPLLPRYAPVDEAHPMDNHDPYGLSKEVDERTAMMFSRLTGMQIAALRFHWIADPDELAAIWPNGTEDPTETAKILWGYVDIRDAAAACRKAIETNFGGFEPFNIVAEDTLCLQPTEAMIAEFAPTIEIRSPLPGFTGGFSVEKAKKVLGWSPQFGWRQ